MYILLFIVYNGEESLELPYMLQKNLLSSKVLFVIIVNFYFN